MTPTNEKNIETNPVKVIRLKCLDCCCGSSKEVALCPAKDCPSWEWRFGKNPYRKTRSLTDEEKATRSARLALARKTPNNSQ